MVGRNVPESERRQQLLSAAFRVAVEGGLGAVTARSVAIAAGTSHGLVFFHFGSVPGLLAALLDRLLADALDAEIPPGLAALPPRARVREMLRIELEGLPEQREAVELVLAYWLRREEVYRRRIDEALDRYRTVFRTACADVVGETSPSAGAVGETSLSADELAGVVVSVVYGAALQVVRAPQSFAVAPYLTALFPDEAAGPAPH